MLCAVAARAGCAGDEPESTRARRHADRLHRGAHPRRLRRSGASRAGRGARGRSRTPAARAGGRQRPAGRALVHAPGRRRLGPGHGRGQRQARHRRRRRDRVRGRGRTSAASAVSLPVTNRAGLLQVSPADGLTSLTQAPAGPPARGSRALLPRRRAHLRAAGAQRPHGRRRDAARRPVARGRRRVAWCTRRASPSASSPASSRFACAAPAAPAVLVEPVRDDPTPPPRLVRDAARPRAPQAVLLAGVRGPSRRWRCSLSWAAELPRTPVIGVAALADGGRGAAGSRPHGRPPRRRRSPPRVAAWPRALARGRRRPRAPESPLRLRRDAAGARRRAPAAAPTAAPVVRAALAPASRRGVTGTYTVLRDRRCRPAGRSRLIDLRDAGAGR